MSFKKNAQYIHYLNHYTHYWLTLSHLTEACEIQKNLDYVGSTQLCQILPSNDHTQDMSRNGDLLEPGGIKFQSEFNKIVFTLSCCFCKKLNWSSTDQLAPLEEDERYPFSRASHDHLLWQGFTFVSFNVNLQDHFFCLYACLVGKVPFCDFSL